MVALQLADTATAICLALLVGEPYLVIIMLPLLAEPCPGRNEALAPGGALYEQQRKDAVLAGSYRQDLLDALITSGPMIHALTKYTPVFMLTC